MTAYVAGKDRETKVVFIDEFEKFLGEEVAKEKTVCPQCGGNCDQILTALEKELGLRK